MDFFFICELWVVTMHIVIMLDSGSQGSLGIYVVLCHTDNVMCFYVHVDFHEQFVCTVFCSCCLSVFILQLTCYYNVMCSAETILIETVHFVSVDIR